MAHGASLVATFWESGYQLLQGPLPKHDDELRRPRPIPKMRLLREGSEA